MRTDSPSADRLSGRNLQVEQRPVSALIPYAKNARTHSDKQVAEIAGSIKAFGWTNPILVDGENGVIAGHGRLQAARKLKLNTVPVIELSGLSEAEKRAYVLADNKLALNAGWDDALLAAEVADLDGLGFDLSLAGFGESEVGALIDLFRQGSAASFPDEAPALPKQPVSRPGDLWLLGEHRLLCGDATKPEDVARVLGGGLADMVFCDPPYNVDYQGGAGKRDRIANDALGSGFGAFLQNACSAMLSAAKGALYICMACAEIDTLKSAFVAAGGHWSTFVIWSKSAFTLGRSDYQRQYEPILYGWPEGNRHYWCGARDQGDVWAIEKPRANDLHPTMKPIALVERAIRNSSKSRDTVLDPFGGSGTTLMAAEATGRRAALIELDPRYCDVIVRRWQEGTGRGATLEADGRSFAQVRQSGSERPGAAQQRHRCPKEPIRRQRAATSARAAREGHTSPTVATEPGHELPPLPEPLCLPDRGSDEHAGRLPCRPRCPAALFPLFGIHTTLAQDSAIAAAFTAVSLVRSYVLRRLFERIGTGRGKGRLPARGTWHLVEER